MVKRFTETEIWQEDWFLSLSPNEMMFWFYIKDKCDHAGIIPPNSTLFKKMTDFSISLPSFLEKVNSDKKRIEVLKGGNWFLTGFIKFQYGPELNPKSKMHESIIRRLEKHGIGCESEVYDFRVKLGVNEGQVRVSSTLKVKDKVKDKDILFNKELIPEDLLSNKPEILEWLEYKKEKGSGYKPKGLGALWGALRSIPASKRKESILHSMANNWSGLFEKKGDKNDYRKDTGDKGSKYEGIGTVVKI